MRRSCRSASVGHDPSRAVTPEGRETGDAPHDRMSHFATSSQEGGLRRVLGVWSATAIVVGSTIGSGVFRSPAQIAEQVPGTFPFLGLWLVGAIIAICGALALAELAAMMPETGGIYVYVREAYGPSFAFAFAWAELVILRPAAYGAISLISAEYTCVALGFDPSESLSSLPWTRSQLVAILYIVVLGFTNVRALVWAAHVQTTSTALKLAALAGLLVVALAIPGQGQTLAAALADAQSSGGSAVSWTGVGVALVGVMWAYDGWADLGFVAGEVEDPDRTLPRALIRGTVIVAIAYLAINAAYVLRIPIASMPGRPLIAADLAASSIGAVGARLVAVAIAISTFGTLNGSLMTGPRIFHALASDGLFFPALAQVHPRFGTPARAIGLSVVLGICFVSVRSFSQLTDQFVIGIWPFYALAVAAVFVLRNSQRDAHRPYRAWLHPWSTGLFLLAAAFLLLSYAVRDPWLVALDIIVVAMSYPIYRVLLARRGR